MNDNDLALYPYIKADLERVRASQIREGDLLAFAGPQGSGRYTGSRVAQASYGGISRMGGEKYLISHWHSSGRELQLHQPESIPLWRVRKDRIKGRAA